MHSRIIKFRLFATGILLESDLTVVEVNTVCSIMRALIEMTKAGKLNGSSYWANSSLGVCAVESVL